MEGWHVGIQYAILRFSGVIFFTLVFILSLHIRTQSHVKYNATVMPYMDLHFVNHNSI